MRSPSQVIDKITSLGIEGNSSNIDDKKVKITNALGICFCLFMIPYLVIFYNIDLVSSTLVKLAAMVLTVASLCLNYRKQYLLAKINLILVILFTAIYFSYLLGLESRSHWHCLSLSLTAMLIFGDETARDRFWRALVAAIAFASYLVLTLGGATLAGTLSLAPEDASLIKTLNVITFIGSNVTQYFIWSRFGQKYKHSLEQQRERLALAMGALNFGIWDWNLKTGTLIWDDSMYRIFGVERASFSGDYDAFEKTLVAEDAKRIHEELKQIFRDKKPVFSSKFRVSSKNNEIKFIRVEASCLYGVDGEISRLVGANWDVTEEKRSKVALIQASKWSDLGMMAAGVAHEINSPLTGLQLATDSIFSELERQGLLSEKIEKNFSRIQKMIHRVSIIVSSLRRFSRDGSQDPVEMASVGSIVTDTLALVESRAKMHGILLQVDDRGADLLLQCRPVQISQVLLNLVNNSIDAIQSLDQKWIRIEVTALDHSQLCISVADSGACISPAIADQIMTPFFTTKPVGKGTGLGLSISQGIIQEHNGTIQLDRASQNTKFVITLPLGNVG